MSDQDAGETSAAHSAPSTGQASQTDADRPLPREVEDALRAAGGTDPVQAALTLAAIANRAVAELNKLARAESTARRGQADWGAWASLANAARDAILKTATCRKVATDLSRRT